MFLDGFFKQVWSTREVLNAMMPPGGGHEDVDISVTDHTVISRQIRAIDVLVAGPVKMDYLDETGTTRTRTTHVAAGIYKPALNVSKIYKTGTSATGITLVW